MKKVFLSTLSVLLISGCATNPVIMESSETFTTDKSKIETSGTTPATIQSITPVSNNPLSFLTPSHKFKLKVGVIRGSGDIIPGAKLEFIFRNFNYSFLQEEMIRKNQPGIDPVDLDFDTWKSTYMTVDCEMIGTYKSCKLDTDRLAQDKIAWANRAYAGIEQEIQRLSGGVAPVTVITDLSGEADVELKAGVWHVSGQFSNAFSTVTWSDVQVNVNSNLTKFELSNDNGEVYNKND